MKSWIYGALAAALLPLTVAVRPAAAQNYFGAIFYSPSTRMYGYSYDYRNSRAAMDAAENECNEYSNWAGDCTYLVQFRNACGSLATAPDGSYGSGWGEDADTAEYYALDTCDQYGYGCEVVETICTTGASW
jgi:serine/threonine-protein kinase